MNNKKENGKRKRFHLPDDPLLVIGVASAIGSLFCYILLIVLNLTVFK